MLDTWTCHICGRERPDSAISVMTYPLREMAGGEYNVRYCNDDERCEGLALIWKHKGEFPHDIKEKKEPKKWWQFWK